MIDPSNNVTTYSYDVDYDISLTGGVTTYTYDVLDAIIAPGGGTTTYTYDFNGSLMPQTSLPFNQDFLLDYSYTESDTQGLNETDVTSAFIDFQAVPEPTSAGAIFLAAAALLRRRKPRH
jgi:hypothetical protein